MGPLIQIKPVHFYVLDLVYFKCSFLEIDVNPAFL